jgi:hypothetical protein
MERKRTCGKSRGVGTPPVMAGHSRSKNGVASLAYVPAIHVFAASKKDVDARDKRGHDEVKSLTPSR